MHKGSCCCGSLRYQFDQEPFDCSYCHCGICRKLTGSDAGAYGSVLKSDFDWISDQDLLSSFAPTKWTTRYFCSRCGSFLLTEHEAEPENVFVSLGSLDTSIATRPLYHQFTSNIPSWCTISSTLPKHLKWPQ